MLVIILVCQMMIVVVVLMVMMVAHGWRPPCGGEWAQRDNTLKVLVIHFAKIQIWCRC